MTLIITNEKTLNTRLESRNLKSLMNLDQYTCVALMQQSVIKVFLFKFIANENLDYALLHQGYALTLF